MDRWWGGHFCRRLQKYPDAAKQKSSNLEKPEQNLLEVKNSVKLQQMSLGVLGQRGDGCMRAPQQSPRKSAALMMFLVVLMRTIKDSTLLPINWLRSRLPVKATPADNSAATCSRAIPIGWGASEAALWLDKRASPLLARVSLLGRALLWCAVGKSSFSFRCFCRTRSHWMHLW